MIRRTLMKGAAAALAAAGSGVVPAAGAAPRRFSLLDAWTGPFGGVPPFDKVVTADFQPAILAGIDRHRAAVRAIAGQPAAATFDNTLAALEDAGRPVGRAESLFFVYAGTMADDTVLAAERDLAPVFAAFDDEKVQNEALFARIRAVHESRDAAGLTAEQRRVAELTHDSFARQGAGLDAGRQASLRQINGELASLYATFGQNLLRDEDDGYVAVAAEADLAGLPDTWKEAYAADARQRGLDGRWTIANTRSAVEPLLTHAADRALREKVYRMWTSRGDHAGATNNRATASTILKLRQQKARLLGQPTYAHWQLLGSMARTPDAALALMNKLWRPALAKFRLEVGEAQALADREQAGHRIAAWDMRYYAERVRREAYDIDQADIQVYLQLDRMIEAIFHCAARVYGLSFRPVSGIPTCHPDVRVYRVTRGRRQVGLYYLDPFARPGKRSGAWESGYRVQERFRRDVRPIVANVCNVVKGRAGEPVLISWTDAITLFHEFGHALHELLSNVSYPSVSGARVLRDFVEFPSQLMERWLETPEVMQRYCLHVRTGQPMPAEWLGRLRCANQADQGFRTTEYLASALYDMRVHLADASQGIDPVEFEQALTAELGLPPEIGLRHRPTAFGHIFGDDGYAAGYYVYDWAAALAADAREAFEQAGGLFDAATARRFHDQIMSVGGSVPPETAFRNFRGRDVDTDALMRERGFPST